MLAFMPHHLISMLQYDLETGLARERLDSRPLVAGGFCHVADPPVI